jgi:hypothetical protein
MIEFKLILQKLEELVEIASVTFVFLCIAAANWRKAL